ncbi:MAG: HAD-IA family hydrolase [Gemmatimonadaceae bacterium]|nr:HAD-IA family hydrolase [Gemmatimonadaceae bacterium]
MPTLDVQAVLFDLDGVLVDSTECVERTWRTWAAAHGLDGDLVVRHAHGRRTAETIALVAPQLAASAEVAALAQSEAAEARGVYPVAGAAALLTQLPRDRWAIVTSGVRAVAEFRIGIGGLPIPRVLVTADDVSRGKPDPEGYLRAAALLGVDPSQCVVVEDAPAGLAAARAAGMHGIGVLGTVDARELGDAGFVVRSVATLVVAELVAAAGAAAGPAGLRISTTAD